MPTPGDWVYVNNFRNPESPAAIYLRGGQGAELRDGMRELVGFLIEQLPKAFRREDFDQERTALRDKYNKRAQELFGHLETRARERGFAIQSAPTGQVIFIPLIEGKMPESPEALNASMQALPEAERERLGKAQGELQDEFATLTMRQQEMMRELIEDIRADRARLRRASDHTRRSPRSRRTSTTRRSTAYLDQVGEHMLDHLDRFREAAGPPDGAPRAAAAQRPEAPTRRAFVRVPGQRDGR